MKREEYEDAMADANYTQVQGIVIAFTQKAVLLHVEGHELWVPKSVIFEDDVAEMEVGDSVEVSIASWFVEREIA